MRLRLLAVFVGSLCACHKTVPTGTVLADWTYEVNDAAPAHVPAPKHPPQIVTQTAEWPVDKGPPMKLRFETEIGDLPDDVHWNWPRHIRITLAEPTTTPLPQIDCMSGPPGNKVVNGALVRPVGHDGVTPTGLVACFFSGKDGASYVFDVNGDGDVRRTQPTGPTR